MNLILKPCQTEGFAHGVSTSRNLFDAQGVLLLAKGEVVTIRVLELLKSHQVYILQFESDKTIPPKCFSQERYQNVLASMQDIYQGGNLVTEVKLIATKDVVDGIFDELTKNPRIYFNLNQFRNFDNYTYVHSVNVGLIASLIAINMGYMDEQLKELILGALLHDLGKMTIPTELLNKPTGLTTQEFEILKQHPIRGVELLKEVKISPEVLAGIRQHHERWNGQGYPDGLKSNAIHPYARVIAVADVFDAITADRPYHEGIPLYYALELVEAGSDSDFAPEVVLALRNSLVIYPENSSVKLNTGEIGIVIDIPSNFPTRPLIRILFDKYGNLVQDEIVVDLLRDLTRFISSVDFQ
ncbi:MAG: HD-GYP domain-containing protein [Desulfosporosinus sp.]|nr:HD-GYP domain-containing protein [Desulfosporosinus sp.]